MGSVSSSGPNPASQLNIINQAFKEGQEVKNLGVNKGSDGQRVFEQVGDRKGKSLESGEIIYFRVANFINDNKDKLIKENKGELEQLEQLVEKNIEKIEKNTTGFLAFFRYLFNPEAKAQKLQQKQYLETLRDFVKQIVEEKKSQSAQIKTPEGLEEEVASIGEERAAQTEEEKSPNKPPLFSGIKKQPSSTEPFPTEQLSDLPLPPKTQKEKLEAPLEQTSIEKESIEKKPTIETEPTTVKVGIPPPFPGNIPPPPVMGAPLKPKLFEGEKAPPKGIDVNKSPKDLANESDEVIQQEVKEIQEFIGNLTGVLGRVEKKIKDLATKEQDLEINRKNVEIAESKLEKITKTYGRLKADEESGAPETKMMVNIDSKNSLEVLFYSDTVFNEKMQGPKNERPLKGQKRSDVLKAFEKKFKEVENELKSCQDNIRRLEPEVAELKKQDGEISGADLAKSLTAKKEVMRKWNLALKRRQDKLAGKEVKEFKFAPQSAGEAGLSSEQIKAKNDLGILFSKLEDALLKIEIPSE
ncbi:hypothetical protein [Candidatus Protochlamydia phocaeensis]|uniref:hypothetical protein n=1 Tax=Candidatus Protochlamydia phocaeensis TaxID=1414722 RepID=UPI00083941B5|nr:hypothetical protein [Candidatus Protochlamydia phocaeensis]